MAQIYDQRLVQATRSVPASGSVTQSSSGGSAVTEDRFSVEVSHIGGQREFRVTNNGQEIINTQTDSYVYSESYDLPIGGGIDLARNVGDGILYAEIFTDLDQTSLLDYRTAGYWLFVPDGASNIADLDIGVFVDGVDPFMQNNILNLTETATYEGTVGAIYNDTFRGVIDGEYNTLPALTGSLTLTADFGDAGTLGSISGHIDDWEIGDKNDSYPLPPDVVMELRRAEITNSGSGFFQGQTFMSHGGSELTGQWGGQFYGNGTPNDIPSGVSGTFGASTDSGDIAILGIFHANHGN